MLRKQKGLFVICGWKKQMDSLVRNIMRLNQSLRAEDIVIIADVTEEDMNKFKNDPDLTKVNIVQGECHNETVLRSVNLMDARKIMVFADFRGNETESDSKTVMTVITVKAIAPRAYVCAEILNSYYETYLKMAMCDEVIQIKEYSRILLANASCSVGVAHIIQDLLDTDSAASLRTEPVPREFIEKPYSELKKHVFSTTDDTLIGLLENTGTLFEMKRHAIHEAQKIADMTKLVQSLQQLKRLEGNKSHLNPPGDYVIPKNSMAIYVRRAQESGA